MEAKIYAILEDGAAGPLVRGSVSVSLPCENSLFCLVDPVCYEDLKNCFVSSFGHFFGLAALGSNFTWYILRAQGSQNENFNAQEKAFSIATRPTNYSLKLSRPPVIRFS